MLIRKVIVKVVGHVWPAALACIVAILLIFLVFRYVESGRHEAGQGRQRSALRIAVPSTPHAALLHIAAARGYFTEEGLDVTMIPVSHGKAALEQLTLGNVDLASAAEVPFVIAVMHGEPLGIVAKVVNAAKDMTIIGRRDRGITEPRDLKGKRVGATFGTSGEYFLWAFLTRHRLLPKDITWVDVPPAKLPEALANGQVDAISTWEPVKTAALTALGSNAITYTAQDAYTVTHIVVGRREYLQANIIVMKRLLRALIRAEAFVYTEPELAQGLEAHQLGLAPSIVASMWNGLSPRVNLRQSQLFTLEGEARWAMERGHAPQGKLPNFIPYFYLDALRSLAPERVTVVH